MAANVESMFWTGRTAPWHGLGIGVENGFVQEGETAEESFIPAFDCEGI